MLVLLPFYSFIFLLLENYGVRKLEAVFAVLIATMAVSFAWMFGEAKPSGIELLLGKNMLLIIQNLFLPNLFLYLCKFQTIIYAALH